MSQRRLALHASALSDAEYVVYTSSLKDLVLGDPDAHNTTNNGEEDDGYFAGMQMGVREARAWLRGRYADVPVQAIDTILRFFSPTLAPADTMSGTEFFAALRLVVHASNGSMNPQEVDRGMAFVQADPTSAQASTSTYTQSRPRTQTSQSQPNSTPSSRTQSPTKRYNPFSQPHPSLHSNPSSHSSLAQAQQPPLHPSHPAIVHGQAHVQPNSSTYGLKRASSTYRTGESAPPSVSRSQGSSQGHGQGYNPFTTVHTVPIASSSHPSASASTPGSGPPPQIPPRKHTTSSSTPASEAGGVGQTSVANKRKSAPPVPPPRPSRKDRDRSISPTKLGTRPAPPLPPPLPSSSSAFPSAFTGLTAHSAPQSLQPNAPVQHITTPLMQQSLHASQIGQSLQKAEARMEKERVMRVLRSSAAPGSSSSAHVQGVGIEDGDGDTGRGRAPPLPQRRPSGRVAPPVPSQGSKPSTSTSKGRQQLPSPPSSMGSMGSMEKVALVGTGADAVERERERERERQRYSSRSPTKPPPPPPPQRRGTVSSVVDASYSAQPSGANTPSRPPPTHPDRAKRNLESFEAVYGPSLVFPAHGDTSNSTPGSGPSQHIPRSPFSPVSPGSPSPTPGAKEALGPPPASAPSPSTSRYGFEPPSTPPGVSPRMVRSKSMHHRLPPGYGAEDAAGSPFASSSPGQVHGRAQAPSTSHSTSHSTTHGTNAAYGTPAPPPPPARRKRPESFQVLSTSNSRGPGGPFGLVSPTTGAMNAYGVVAAAGYGSTANIPERGGMGYVPPAKPFNAFGPGAGTATTPVRRSSLSVSATPPVAGREGRRGDKDGQRDDTGDGDRERDKDVFAALEKDSASTKDRPNPIAGLKNTFANANAALMPTLERAREGLDKARYKAEAGLSRRGYMRHNVGYGYSSGGGGEVSSDDEAPLSDTRGDGYGDAEDEMQRGMGGLSLARERERDRLRERQEMAGLVGGVDGRMKAPSVHMSSKHGKSSREKAQEALAQARGGNGYGLERDWNSDDDRPSVDDGPHVDSDEEEQTRRRLARGMGPEKDTLKWPAGEGWKSL